MSQTNSSASSDFDKDMSEEKVFGTEPNHGGHDHPQSIEFGFWLYLMTDCLLFASFFATYAVLFMNTAGAPGGAELFDPKLVMAETGLLLTSTMTFGFAMVEARRCARTQAGKGKVLLWLGVTFLLGAGFVALEVHEFSGLIADGYGPDRSAFLSSFFALVGLHGLHVTAGLIWILFMIFEVKIKGTGGRTLTRLGRLGLFWHFLDLVWVSVFTFVYLFGVAQ